MNSKVYKVPVRENNNKIHVLECYGRFEGQPLQPAPQGVPVGPGNLRVKLLHLIPDSDRFRLTLGVRIQMTPEMNSVKEKQKRKKSRVFKSEDFGGHSTP